MYFNISQLVAKCHCLTFILIFSSIGYGQSCIPQDIILETQIEVNNFQIDYPNCDTIKGSLSIGFFNPTNISNLNGLSGITHISANLRIFNNPDLSNLVGLNNLTSVSGSLFIDQNNFSLVSLDGLNNLETVGKEFTISNNGGLLSLNGLDKLATIDSNLTISANLLLDDLSGLEALSSIGGFLRVSGNDNMTNLSGIENLDLTAITDLRLLANPKLSNCSVRSICEYLSALTNTSVIGINLSGCNTRTEIEMSCGLLPVELISFTGSSIKDEVQLRWSTSHEVNNMGFDVQRSTDRQNWESIGFQSGTNQIDREIAYQMIDHHPIEGENYYRLKQLDYDGSYTFSPIIIVRVNKLFGLSIFPNPASNWLFIKNAGIIEHFEITSAAGKVYPNLRLLGNKVDISLLPSGIYFVSVQIGEIYKTIKLVKHD